MTVKYVFTVTRCTVVTMTWKMWSVLLRNAYGRSTGDGMGYSLTVTKHYESYAQKLKDRAKEQDGSDEGKKEFRQ
jgi:transposase